VGEGRGGEREWGGVGESEVGRGFRRGLDGVWGG